MRSNRSSSARTSRTHSSSSHSCLEGIRTSGKPSAHTAGRITKIQLSYWSICRYGNQLPGQQPGLQRPGQQQQHPIQLQQQQLHPSQQQQQNQPLFGQQNGQAQRPQTMSQLQPYQRGPNGNILPNGAGSAQSRGGNVRQSGFLNTPPRQVSDTYHERQ